MSIKFFILTTIILVTLADSGLAQDPPPPPPPPARDYSPTIWQEFSFPAGGFKVKLPGEPTQSVREIERDGQKVAVTTVSCRSASFITYTVVYTDFTQNLEDPPTAKKLFDGMRDSVLTGLNGEETRLLSETEFALEGHPGRLLQLEVGKKAILRSKRLAVGNRLYQVNVLTMIHSPNAMASANGYEKIAMSFLDSFSLLKPTDRKQ